MANRTCSAHGTYACEKHQCREEYQRRRRQEEDDQVQQDANQQMMAATIIATEIATGII